MQNGCVEVRGQRSGWLERIVVDGEEPVDCLGTGAFAARGVGGAAVADSIRWGDHMVKWRSRPGEDGESCVLVAQAQRKCGGLADRILRTLHYWLHRSDRKD